jgi:hypothetical protein
LDFQPSLAAGTVSTGHGGILATHEAHQWVDAQTRYYHLVKDGPGRRLELYLSKQRCFTQTQRLALAARDQHCGFPGCDVPPQWCQAHHVIPWQNGGPTSLDNATLLCGHHHRSFERLGWTVHMTDGHPEWTPPPWLTRNVA